MTVALRMLVTSIGIYFAVLASAEPQSSYSTEVSSSDLARFQKVFNQERYRRIKSMSLVNKLSGVLHHTTDALKSKDQLLEEKDEAIRGEIRKEQRQQGPLLQDVRGKWRTCSTGRHCF